MRDKTLASITELTRMAQFYDQHGHPGKAAQIMELVERMVRSLGDESSITDMTEFRSEEQQRA